MFAREVRQRRASYRRGFRHWHWHWHLDEVFVKITGQTHYRWCAVNHEGEIIQSHVTEKRGKSAARTFMKKALKRHGEVETIVTHGLPSYPAAMRALGNLDRREIARELSVARRARGASARDEVAQDGQHRQPGCLTPRIGFQANTPIIRPQP